MKHGGIATSDSYGQYLAVVRNEPLTMKCCDKLNEVMVLGE